MKMRDFIGDLLENFLSFMAFVLKVVVILGIALAPALLMFVFDSMWLLLLYCVNIPFLMTLYAYWD